MWRSTQMETFGRARIRKFSNILNTPKTKTYPAPSQIMRIDPKTGDYDNIYVSLDGEFSAATVAAVAGEHIYAGSVFESDILKCPL